MKGDETRRLGTLYAGAMSLVADGTPLDNLNVEK